MSARPLHRLRRPLLAALAVVMAAHGLQSVAVEPEVAARENQLKAGYLLNFAKLVEWPPSTPADSLTICVLGETGLYDALAIGLGGKRIGVRTLNAYRLAQTESTARCSVLYIDSTATGAGGTLPATVLTVSDAKDFAHRGGIIELFTENNRLRFIINLDNARRAGLRINPSLLQLAAAVHKEATP
jgi:hypothetical protein